MDAKPPLRIVLAASDISINYRLSLSMDIFISYRRQDTSGYALGLRRLFRTELPSASVFLDIDSIDAGGRWREVIRGRLSECDVMLVLIGDEWLVMRDGQKKLEQADDPVRFELEYVLRRNITIIPILVEEAKIPSGSDLPEGIRRLCEYNAHAIHDQTYDQDVTRLVQTLRNLDDTESEPPPPGPQPPGTGSGATFPSRPRTEAQLLERLSELADQRSGLSPARKAWNTTWTRETRQELARRFPKAEQKLLETEAKREAQEKALRQAEAPQ